MEDALNKKMSEVFNIINMDTRKPVEIPIERVISEGATVGEANKTILIARKGTEIPIESNAAPIRDDRGNIIGVVLVFRDITERRKVEEDREKLIVELKEALVNIKILSGLLPICAYCKKIRDDEGYWHQVDKYISEHTGAMFTHGMCPACYKKAMEELINLKHE
ncbi:MAG: PAS domain-containing protein [Nitrospira sp.]|nr:PAS domain-containing protein [Nitrospira sp.]